jgi:hypothetical protein
MQSMSEALLSVIKDPEATEEQVHEAVASLPSEAEPPGYWMEIANDPTHRTVRRRLSVFQLFRRHVPPGLSLSELAHILEGADWLSDQDVEVVHVLAGKIPVTWTPDDTVVALDVLPDPDDRERWTVYLRISGKVSREDLVQVIRGRDPNADEARSAIILEIGFSPATGG